MKSCLLTVSEKFERSKVSTNSFDSDSDSSAPILVRDDTKRHTANTTKQIETLDAIFLIPTPSVFVVFWFSGLERERDKYGLRTRERPLRFFLSSAGWNFGDECTRYTYGLPADVAEFHWVRLVTRIQVWKALLYMGKEGYTQLFLYT